MCHNSDGSCSHVIFWAPHVNQTVYSPALEQVCPVAQPFQGSVWNPLNGWCHKPFLWHLFLAWWLGYTPLCMVADVSYAHPGQRLPYRGRSGPTLPGFGGKMNDAPFDSFGGVVTSTECPDGFFKPWRVDISCSFGAVCSTSKECSPQWSAVEKPQYCSEKSAPCWRKGL